MFEILKDHAGDLHRLARLARCGHLIPSFSDGGYGQRYIDNIIWELDKYYAGETEKRSTNW